MKIKRLPQPIELKLIRDFGDEIKRIRNEVGLSQKELAEMIGLKSGTAISLYESNKRQISIIDFWRICCVCGYNLKLEEL